MMHWIPAGVYHDVNRGRNDIHHPTSKPVIPAKAGIQRKNESTPGHTSLLNDLVDILITF